jgi:membrane protease YdiL (CAAX protease family)
MTIRDVPAFLWLALILVAIPWGAIVAARRKRAGLPLSERAQRAEGMSRPTLYLASVLGIAQLLLVTVLIDGIDRWPAVRKSLSYPREGWLWIAGCVAAHQMVSFTSMLVRRARGLPLDAGTARLLPRDRGEFLRFVPLALMAGINEEFIYRGFAPDHLVRWGLPLPVAVAFATAAFGLAHGYKSLAGMMRAALIGLVLAVPVLATGTLLPSIVAHAIMDLLAGANTIRLARKLGVTIPEPGPAPVGKPS